MNTLTGDEHFTFDDVPVNRLLNDFWSWQASDLLDVYVRGAMAEYIVAVALDIDSQSRINWLDHDLEYNGMKIEVKSSTNLMIENTNNTPIKLKNNSQIRFSIAPNQRVHSMTDCTWNEDGIYRHSDIYIFCTFYCNSLTDANPMRLEQWIFYIVKTTDIDKLLGQQRSISISTILSIPHKKCNFDNLKFEINSVLENEAES